jgi:hypothetical protein
MVKVLFLTKVVASEFTYRAQLAEIDLRLDTPPGPKWAP